MSRHPRLRMLARAPRRRLRKPATTDVVVSVDKLQPGANESLRDRSRKGVQSTKAVQKGSSGGYGRALWLQSRLSSTAGKWIGDYAVPHWNRRWQQDLGSREGTCRRNMAGTHPWLLLARIPSRKAPQQVTSYSA